MVLVDLLGLSLPLLMPTALARVHIQMFRNGRGENSLQGRYLVVGITCGFRNYQLDTLPIKQLQREAAQQIYKIRIFPTSSTMGTHEVGGLLTWGDYFSDYK